MIHNDIDYPFYLVSSSCSVPPIITGQRHFPENVSVVVKNPVSLSCEASGIPLPSISWLKDGRPVKATSLVRILSGEFDHLWVSIILQLILDQHYSGVFV